MARGFNTLEQHLIVGIDLCWIQSHHWVETAVYGGTRGDGVNEWGILEGNEAKKEVRIASYLFFFCVCQDILPAQFIKPVPPSRADSLNKQWAIFASKL